MIVLGVILGVILLLLATIGVGNSVKDNYRKKKCNNWKIGINLF
jgi:hypothetical protein